jgi:hypothetical protein
MASRLAGDLESQGIAAWFTPRDLDPGTTWPQAIEQGLQSSSHVAILLSPRTMESRAVQLEVQMAEMLSLEDKIAILPLLIEPMTLPPWLGVIQYIDFTASYQDGLDAMLKRLNGAGERREPSSVLSAQGGAPTRPGIHRVCRGERIDLLADSWLGHPGAWRVVMSMNPHLDARRLEPGTPVILPASDTRASGDHG